MNRDQHYTPCDCRKFQRCSLHLEPVDPMPDPIPTVCLCGAGFAIVKKTTRIHYYECLSCQLPVHRRMC